MPSAQRFAALAGIGMMLLGVFMFSLNDAMGKWLVATYAVGQVLVIRSAFSLIMLTPLVLREGVGRVLRPGQPWLQAARVAAATAEIGLFYWMLAYLQLADAMTFLLASPIFVVALSPLALGERVGARRWLLVGVGFVGVVIALKPSSEAVSLPALGALTGALMFALMNVTGRLLRDTSDVTLVFWQAVGALALGLVLVPFAWVTPSLLDFSALALLGLVSTLGHMCVTRSLKLAPASTVAPYQYTFIAWAVVWGWLMFGEVPEVQTMVGAAVIVLAGLVLLWSEARAGRRT
ncbi:DMT family transporter [Blastochloris viridis]|uniref:Permease of the drug/metabolite transporter superfamily n=1 Tax=Blastochloris viridis TaxID=1079 RepID=A0A0H5BET5_BLAVI|nr:DMT family transporter [Blastochloris viridis]ALK09393.1 Riboflavin transporter [Blastochloris viridis]BAS00728.1 permease of the drug/metabolite transporter superfamily [Blastochloris viridis]CUU42056.1 putative permease, DMT superfamily [Blastochloris viridis]